MITFSELEIMGYVFCATVNLEELANKRKREEEALEAAKKEAEAQAVQKKVTQHGALRIINLQIDARRHERRNAMRYLYRLHLSVCERNSLLA